MSGRGPQAKRSGRDKLSKTAKGFRQHSISPPLPALPTLPCLPARRRHISPQIVSPNPLPARKRHNFAPFVSKTPSRPKKDTFPPKLCLQAPSTPAKDTFPPKLCLQAPSTPAKDTFPPDSCLQAPSTPAKDTFPPKLCLADGAGATGSRGSGVAATHLQGRRPCNALQRGSGGKCVAARQRGGAWERGDGYAFAGAEALQRIPAGVRMQMRCGKAARRAAGAGRGRERGRK